MEIYERMKELQLSYQDRSRMRGARLQAMWNRICEDEQKSILRNQELIRDFERVENHLNKLSTTTERLRLARQQYMDYIVKSYPQWVASKQQELPVTISEPQVKEHLVQQPERDGNTPHASNTHEREQAVGLQESINQQIDSSIAHENIAFNFQHQEPPEEERNIQSPECELLNYNLPNLPREEMMEEIVRPSVVSPVASDVPFIMEPSIVTRKKSESSEKKQFTCVGELESQKSRVEQTEVVPARSEPLRARISDNWNTGLNSPRIRKLAVRDGDEEVLIPTLQLGSTDGTGVTVGTGTLSNQMSELFGSIQLGQSQNLDSTMASHDFSEHEHSESLEPKVKKIIKQPELMISHSQEADDTNNTIMAYLSLDGLCRVMKTVTEDFSVSFNPEAFYRSDLMDSTTRRKLIHCANNDDNLDHFDSNCMSMVILEELPIVCRSLPGGCLVRDEVLEDISFMVREIVFRAKLTTDGRQLWEVLSENMKQGIIHGVLTAREMALMIGPSLLGAKSAKKEKLVTVLTSLLQSPDEAITSEVSSTATSVNTSPNKNQSIQERTAYARSSLVEESPRSSLNIKPRVNPLSPRDISVSDDDCYDRSTPRYKPDFSLTGTAAYKSMMSSGGLTRSVDDGDDDLEEILVPRNAPVVIPTTTRTDDSSTAATPRGDVEDDDDDDTSIITSVPLPVNVTDKLVKTPYILPDGRANILQSSNGSAGLRSGSGSGSQQPSNVIHRLISESDFSDTEISLPALTSTGGQRQDKSEVDDFDGFFD